MASLGIACLVLHSGAAALIGAPSLRPSVVQRAAASPVCVVELDPSQIQVIAGAAAVLIGGGAIGLQAKQSKVVKLVEDAPAAPAVVERPPPPLPQPPPAYKPQYSGKITVGQHRMAGRAKPPPPREQWVPPAGWKKPKKPVTSWYDRGDRLTPMPVAAPPPPPPKQLNLFEQFFSKFGAAAKGGAAAKDAAVFKPAYTGKVTVSQHRMAGRAKKPPPREQWVPPPGWTPPAKKTSAPAGVKSWYDSGKRL